MATSYHLRKGNEADLSRIGLFFFLNAWKSSMLSYHQKSFLIVDDFSDFRSSVRSMLRELGQGCGHRRYRRAGAEDVRAEVL
jgi:hypoxanthine phosphoribosyltransferase